MGNSKTVLAVTSAVLAQALFDQGVEIEVIHLEDERREIPDFKEVRTDPAFRRDKTHPTSWRK